MRYRVKIKTESGEVRTYGIERAGLKDIEGIRKFVIWQQTHESVRRNKDGDIMSQQTYMPAGEIISLEVVPDNEPVPLVDMKIGEDDQGNPIIQKTNPRSLA